jgi:hypothetical protein
MFCSKTMGTPICFHIYTAIYKCGNVCAFTEVGQLCTELLRTCLAKVFRARIQCQISKYVFLSVSYLSNEFLFYRCFLAVCHLSQRLYQELPKLLLTTHRVMQTSATTPVSTS